MPTSRRILRAAIAAALLAAPAVATPSAQPRHGVIIPLYAKGTMPALGVPESTRHLDTGEPIIFNVSEPTLEMFRPARGHGNGTAMIVVPGGGFVGLGYASEGTDVALALARRGITAFVLKYRTIQSAGNPATLPDAHLKEMDLIMARAKTGLPVEVPQFAGEQNAVADGARAIAIVRQRARAWGIDPHRVGMIGFSAGGYLAADLAIGPKASRPDFVALIYGGLRTPVPTDAPPAFIVAAADDPYQPNDAVLLFGAWRGAGVPAELHVYERGGHGFGLKPQGASSDHWFDDLLVWLRSQVLLTTRSHDQRISAAKSRPQGDR